LNWISKIVFYGGCRFSLDSSLIIPRIFIFNVRIQIFLKGTIKSTDKTFVKFQGQIVKFNYAVKAYCCQRYLIFKNTFGEILNVKNLDVKEK